MNKYLKDILAVLGVIFLCVVFLCVFAFLFSGDNSLRVVENTPTKTRVVPSATPKATRTPRPTPTPSLGSRNKPVGFGEEILIGSESVSYISAKVIDVVRGYDAWVIVENSNMFNEQPSAEMEYLIATVEVSYLEALPERGDILNVSQGDWKFVSNGQIFDWFSDKSPCCFEDSGVVVGGTAKMTIANQVYINDETPYLIFMDKFFFSTK